MLQRYVQRARKQGKKQTLVKRVKEKELASVKQQLCEKEYNVKEGGKNARRWESLMQDLKG